MMNEYRIKKKLNDVYKAANNSTTYQILNHESTKALGTLCNDVLNIIKRKNAEINARKQMFNDAEALMNKAIKDFTEFAQTAFENPFACKYCKYSVREGRACLWKAEHEEESCLGRYFEYKEAVRSED